MSDAEREAELRKGPVSGLPRGGDVAFVIRLLDEVRADRDETAQERDDALVSFERAVQKEIELRAEIARLPAPPDRLDEAARAIDHIKALGYPTEPPFESREGDWQTCCDRCRAQVLLLRLTAPSGASAMERAGKVIGQIVSGHVVRPANILQRMIAEAIEQAEREARQQVIEAAALACAGPGNQWDAQGRIFALLKKDRS